MSNNKLVTINLNKIDNKALYRLVREAIKSRKCTVGGHVRVSDFCQAAGISRSQFYSYAKGATIGRDGVLKIATGLRAWGYAVDIIF